LVVWVYVCAENPASSRGRTAEAERGPLATRPPLLLEREAGGERRRKALFLSSRLLTY